MSSCRSTSADHDTLTRFLRRIAPRRPTLTTLLCIGALLGTLIYSLATLTRFPSVYGDEAWIGSTAWSFVSGHGFRAALSVGGGLYDHGAVDYWFPRIGTLPFIIADLIAGPSFWAFRFASFLIGVAALAVFVLGLRRRYGAATATMAGVALAASWGFFSTSHYIRWDSLAFLLVCVLLAVFLRGTPSLRTCLLVGLMFGVAPDIESSLLAAVPAVILLILWERGRRLARLGLLLLGMAGGALAYLALHDFPFGHAAHQQYALIYAPAYKVPLEQVLQQHSLAPIWHESLRYTFMKEATPADLLGFHVLLLGLAAFVLVLFLYRPRAAYPTQLVAGLLLVSHLGGLALIQGNKSPVHAWYALPYAIAVMVEALRRIVAAIPDLSPAARRIGPVVLLALLAAVELNAVVDVQKTTPPEPMFSKRFQTVAHSVIRPNESVLGDFFYWWAFKDANYHWNAWIWNYRWSHHASLDAAFNRLCPDVVLYDDVWNSRYAEVTTFGPRFPSMAPTDPNEQAALHALLLREYTRARDVTIDGRNIQFWVRRQGACHGILTDGGGTT